jgi:uncharacterized protein (DUF1786 family)
MQILAVDVGTGTQDILLLRAGLSLENAFRLVMPSPTMIVRRRLQLATRRGEGVLLTGVMMGGGPCHWAAEDHLRAGLPLFATPEAARTFNDDLDWVEREMGVRLVAPEDARRLSGVTEIALTDFDLPALRQALQAFGLALEPTVAALAVFDHGAAPPDVSDRQFRFDYLASQILQHNQLTAFAHRSEDIPPSMTRMLAAAQSARGLGCPLLLMDTAPAAVLGATLDSSAAAQSKQVIANVGNFHTLAFRLGPQGIEGVFEHHTGLIDRPRLEHLLLGLAGATVTHQEVFEDHGHGAWLRPGIPAWRLPPDASLIVTGPRRGLLARSDLQPHMAAPYGDMMLTGCYGLVLAVAEHLPDLAEPLRSSLAGEGATTPPWEAE